MRLSNSLGSLLTLGLVLTLGAETRLNASTPAQKSDGKKSDQALVPQIKQIKLGPTFVRSPGQGRVDSPKTITNPKELAKAFSGETAQGSVKKQVDFKTQKLVLFSWSGSGRDSIQPKVVKVEKEKPKNDSNTKPAANSKEPPAKPEYKIVFQYSAGRTRDFRRHIHAFVIPKDISFTVKRTKGR